MNHARGAPSGRSVKKALLGGVLRVGLGLLAGTFGSACTKASPRVESIDAGANASASASANVEAGAAPAQPILTLGDKLAFEATHRTAVDTPKVEEVYAALEKAGFRLSEKQQHVASVFGAKYCMGAKTENDMAFSACEYDSAAEAASGREMSLKALASVPNREIHVNRRTTLTIRQPANTTSASQEATRTAAGVFKNL